MQAEKIIEKYPVYTAVRGYLETTYGAYSLENIGNARKFSIGWDKDTANAIHKKLVEYYGFTKTTSVKGESTSYVHNLSGLGVGIYLDSNQSPARYYFQFGWLF